MATKNAIQILIDDHEKLKGLLEELSDTSDRAEKKRTDLLSRIETELKIHTTLEEEIFYPAFKDVDGKESEKMYYEAKEEHRAVENLVLPDLKNTEPASVEFAGRAKVLKELIEHHVEEEEEDMFPEAEEQISEEELMELGARMEERRKELRATL